MKFTRNTLAFVLLISLPFIFLNAQCVDPIINEAPTIIAGEAVIEHNGFLSASCPSDCIDPNDSNFICGYEAYGTAYYWFMDGTPNVKQLRGLTISDPNSTGFISNLDSPNALRGGTIKNGYLLLVGGNDVFFMHLNTGEITTFNDVYPSASFKDIEENTLTEDFYIAGSISNSLTQLYKLEVEFEDDCSAPLSVNCVPVGDVTGDIGCPADLSINSLGEAYIVDADQAVLTEISLTTGEAIADDIPLNVNLYCTGSSNSYNTLQFADDTTLTGLMSKGSPVSKTLVSIDITTGIIDTLNPSYLHGGGYAFMTSFALCENSEDIQQVHWYDQAVGGSLQGVGETLDPTGTTAEEGPFDNEIVGSYTYYVQCGDDPSCERVSIAIEVTCPGTPSVISQSTLSAGQTITPDDFLFVSCLAGCAAGEEPEDCGADLYAFEYPSYSLLDVDPVTGNLDTITSFSSGITGSVIINNYWIGGSGPRIEAMNIEDGSKIVLNDDTPGFIDVEQDPTTGLIYGINSAALYFIDIEFDTEGACGIPISASYEFIGTLNPQAISNPITIVDFVISNQGDAYLFTPTLNTSLDPNLLFNLSLSTGATFSSIELNNNGNTNLFFDGGSRFTYNPDVDGVFYGIGTYIGDADFMSINPITGQVSNINNYPYPPHTNDIQGLAFCQAAQSTVLPPKWYDKPIGGTLQGIGESLDPTGTIAEEGPFDINAAGTYSYYAQCGADESCGRTLVQVIVDEGCNIEDFNDGESAWGIWQDGGADAALANKPQFANSGSYAFMIKDNTSSSEIRTTSFDLTGFAKTRIDFNYVAHGFNNANEDFFLEVSMDGGNTFTIIEEWNLGDEFENDVREYESVDLLGPFSTNTVFRFRCDASANNDKLYIDDISIETCGVLTCLLTDQNNAESGWGIWQDGGADAALSNNPTFANSGVYAFLIKDDTPSSEIRTADLDLSNSESLILDFNYITNGFDNANEDFFLEISTDGGNAFTVIEEWNLGDEFENDVREFENVAIPGPFSTSTVIRFRCDASGNNDKVYIDDIKIESCGGANLIPESENRITADASNGILVYPNPTNLATNLKLHASERVLEYSIYNIAGEKLLEQTVDQERPEYTITTQELNQGTYIIHVKTIKHQYSEKIIILH